MHFKSLTLAATVGVVTAQSSSITFCDKYAMALYHNNTIYTQYQLISAVVNTALLGNSMYPLPVDARLMELH